MALGDPQPAVGSTWKSNTDDWTCVVGHVSATRVGYVWNINDFDARGFVIRDQFYLNFTFVSI